MAVKMQKVALAGAAGALGAPMLQALLDAKYDVTVLTRPNSESTFPDTVKVAKVDYDDTASLSSALHGNDALISTVGSAAIRQQKTLIDAAISAHVKRIIPSEFGCDLLNPKARPLPVYGHKVEIEEYLDAKCKGTETTYSLIFNNCFLDWGLEHGFVMSVKDKRIRLVDGGDVKFTATPLALVAQGTVSVLQHLEETANRAVRLHGYTTTLKHLLASAQQISGKEGWQVEEISSADLVAKSYENLKHDPKNVMAWLIGFLLSAAVGRGYGGDYSSDNDNGLLGLKEVSEKEVDAMIQSCA